MYTPEIKLSALLSGVTLVLFGASAEAHHFRGAALVPSVSATGVLTVTATSFWRNDSPLIYDIDDINVGDKSNPLQVASAGLSVGFMGKTTGPLADLSDSRHERTTSTFKLQLKNAGLYEISAGDTLASGRVDGAPNVVDNSLWIMNSSIFWDGKTTSTPILFNLSTVQPTLIRGAAYTGNLDAFATAGLTLSYDQTLNDSPDGLTAQPPGFTIDPTTGALNIPAAFTTAANYPDNPDPDNAGADVAFSGNIYARDATGALRGQVEFEFMFDAVDADANRPPSITQVIINALVGGNLSTVFTAKDDGLPTPPGTLTWTGLGWAGSPGSCSNAPNFSTTNQQFSWNTAGCTPGPYVYQVRASDSEFSDIGTVTINLASQPEEIPEPAILSLLALGALGLAGLRRRRS